MKKLGCFGGVRGYPRSSETSPFDRAHMTFYSTLTKTIRLSCTVFELQRVFQSKLTNFNPPHLHSSPPQGVIPFEFRHDLWRQKTSHGAIVRRCLLRDPTFSRFDTIPECDRHTDRHTDTRRRHIPRLAQRRAVKINSSELTDKNPLYKRSPNKQICIPYKSTTRSQLQRRCSQAVCQ